MARKSEGIDLKLTGEEHEFLADLVLAYQLAACPTDCEGVPLRPEDASGLRRAQHDAAHTMFNKLRCLSFAEEGPAESIVCNIVNGYAYDEKPPHPCADEMEDFEDEDEELNDACP